MKKLINIILSIVLLSAPCLMHGTKPVDQIIIGLDNFTIPTFSTETTDIAKIGYLTAMGFISNYYWQKAFQDSNMFVRNIGAYFPAICSIASNIYMYKNDSLAFDQAGKNSVIAGLTMLAIPMLYKAALAIKSGYNKGKYHLFEKNKQVLDDSTNSADTVKINFIAQKDSNNQVAVDYKVVSGRLNYNFEVLLNDLLRGQQGARFIKLSKSVRDSIEQAINSVRSQAENNEWGKAYSAEIEFVIKKITTLKNLPQQETITFKILRISKEKKHSRSMLKRIVPTTILLGLAYPIFSLAKQGLSILS